MTDRMTNRRSPQLVVRLVATRHAIGRQLCDMGNTGQGAYPKNKGLQLQNQWGKLIKIIFMCRYFRPEYTIL